MLLHGYCTVLNYNSNTGGFRSIIKAPWSIQPIPALSSPWNISAENCQIRIICSHVESINELSHVRFPKADPFFLPRTVTVRFMPKVPSYPELSPSGSTTISRHSHGNSIAKEVRKQCSEKSCCN